MIRQFYIQNYTSKRIQDYQFENLIITATNKKEIEIVKDFTQKCINKNQKKWTYYYWKIWSWKNAFSNNYFK